MNVMVYNKYKDLLLGLNIEVMKSLEGVHNVDEIIDTFTNFYYDKMILDITAIRDYQNTDNLQKLAMNINMENVILLLDDNPETDTKSYLSKLISLGIYNFTKNADGINYLLVHPHTYRDVVNIHNLEDLDIVKGEKDLAPEAPKEVDNNDAPVNNGKIRIIGFKNVTQHAGATTFIYMLKKAIEDRRSVIALEIDKVDFLYFNQKNMISSTSNEILKDIMHRNTYDVILLDLNDYEDVGICSEVYYLIEPSTIMINKMMRRDKSILQKLKNEKVILNKCMLSNEDIATFEYETKLKLLCSIPCVDDRQSIIEPIKKFVSKINL